MLTDGRRLCPGDVRDADVCIVGGGPAGLTIAGALAGGPWRVVLLEGGDLEVRDAVQARHAGSCTAAAGCRPYPSLDESRVHALGGATHRWGGWCHPLDAEDFEPRAWIPDSGWPFPRSRLEPHYARAREVCGLGHAAAGPAPPPIADGGGVGLEALSFGIAPVRFGAACLPRLRAAANVEVVLHASARRLRMCPYGTSARGVEVATATGHRVVVRARMVVLAAGGLENPRLLLASAGAGGAGVGNAHDLVGRYFADHLHVPIGTLRPASLAVGRAFGRPRAGPGAARAGLALAAATRREHALLGSAVTLHNADDPHDVASPGASAGGYPSLMVVARALRRGRWPDALPTHVSRVAGSPLRTLALSYRRLRPPPPARLTIALRAEQSPDRESRVVLAEPRDAADAPRLRLEWRLAPRDLDSIERTQRLLARALADARPTMFPREGADGWLARLAPGAHHMGTTRMHADPRRGVVDGDGRVHGTTNVFVAGSSVFPTGGWAPPTLTIVALALRLAEHLHERLRRAPPAAPG